MNNNPNPIKLSFHISALLVSGVVGMAPALAEEVMWRYTVRPGDNLITLGKKHLINASDWKVLQRVNQVKDPRRLSVGGVLKLPINLVKKRAASAEVVFVSGEAQWQQSANGWQVLEAGQLLGPGAKITTKDNSKVVLRFADGTTSNLVSNSTLSLDTLSLYSAGVMVDTKLRLQKGQLETHANPQHVKGNQMQVITPTAIAAVRGTTFRVTAGQGATTQETLEGQVALNASNEEIAINKGFGSKAEQGKAPLPPVALLPAADVSHLNKQYESLPVTFDVPPIDDAVTWVAKVSTDAEFNQVVSEAEFQSNQLAFADVPDGPLYLNLRPKDHHGIVGYEVVHQFNVNARPFQPKIVSPAEGAMLRVAQPTLQWQAVADADQYVVEVATDAAFTQPLETKQVDGLQTTLEQRLTQGQYFWRVSSVALADNGQANQGPALTSSRFSYKPAPSMPDVSQLHFDVARNHVFIQTLPPLEGHTYQARLANSVNHQENVWQGSELGEQFDFPLKEYGPQVLYIRHVDSEGVESDPAIYEFDVQPE